MRGKKSYKEMKDYFQNHYYFKYTICFCVMSIFIYSTFLYYGKSFVFCDNNLGGDGLVQHYNSFVYYGKYLRTIIKGILFEHQLKIPMWDMSIGYGQDIITTLSYYVIGDPFSALSVFVPVKYAEYAYSFLILLRMYCAGLAFSAYCRFRGEKSFSVLVGSMIYVFCYYALSSGVLHPYFILPMIYLPLTLMGVEKILLHEKIGFYTFTLALAGISNFYFFYMLCIIILLYTISRYVEIYGVKDKKHLIKMVWRFVYSTGIAVGMAAVLLLPSILNVLNASRVSVKTYVPLFYTIQQYLKILPAFINGGFVSYSYYGYCGIGLLCVVILVMSFKKEKAYYYMFLRFAGLMLVSMIPFLGHVFNGFSYVTNRWIWALAMMCAYIVVVFLPKLPRLYEKNQMAVWVSFGLVIVSTVMDKAVRTEKNWLAVVEYAVTIFVVCEVLKLKKQRVYEVICFVLVGIGLYLHAFYLYSPTEESFVAKYVNMGQVYDMLVKESPAYAVTKVKEDDLYRFDTAGYSAGMVKRNSAMQLRQNGVAYYYSTTNDMVSEFINDLALNYSMDQSYEDLNSRTILEYLFGVKYFVVQKGNKKDLPYGYSEKVAKAGENVVYATNNSMPIGFATDNMIRKSQYEMLSPLEKQEALSQGIVVADEFVSKDESVDFGVTQLSYSIVPGKGVTVRNHELIVTEENATIEITFKPTKKQELYVYFDNLDFDGVNPYIESNVEDYDEMSRYEKVLLRQRAKDFSDQTSAKIALECEDVVTDIPIKNEKDVYYCGHKNFLGNLGYNKKKRKSITLSFSNVGIYRFDDLQVLEQPIKQGVKTMQKMAEQSLENYELSTNQLSGIIDMKKAGVLCVQIPYSKGWKAYVDGKETETLVTDEMFLGVLLDVGEHDIVFQYQTPYLKMAIMVSLIFCTIFIGIVFLKNKKTKKHRQIGIK